MKKVFLFVMSAVLLMTAGMVTTGCSSDDDNVATPTPEAPVPGHATRVLPKQVDFIKTVTDTGILRCDKADNSWYIDSPYDGPEIMNDGGSMYYLYDLPKEYQKSGLKVKVTLDCYTFRHFDEKVVIDMYAGYDYYDTVLKEIEVVE